MHLSRNAEIVLGRYLLKDNEGKIIETPEKLFKRVAKNIAKEDSRYNSNKKEITKTEKEFFEAMTQFEFLPNLPTIANAGKKLQKLAACFVLNVPDRTEGIFEAVNQISLIQITVG